ncbi:MAG: hypothetical protein AAB152_12580 [Candidatus Coatesbacteria bacterium]
MSPGDEFPRPRKLIPVTILLFLVTGGCGGARVAPGVFATAHDTGTPPRHLGLLFPQVEAGAAGRVGAWPGGRAFMASEVAAVVHVRMLEEMERRCAPDWKDLAAEKKAKERMALLSSVIHRDWSLSGQITVRLAGELGRASGQDACLLVSVTRFGPSPSKLELKSLSGVIKPGTTGETAASWINCGVKLVVFRTPGGQVLWEAGGLASLPVTGPGPDGVGTTQEAAVARVVADLMRAFPWPK